EMGKLSVPFLVDTSLDQYPHLSSSAIQFVQNAHQKWCTSPELHHKLYIDMVSAKLVLGYQNHVSPFYSQIDPDEKLIYSRIVHDLFNRQFTLSSDKKITTGSSCVYQAKQCKVDPSLLKKELMHVQNKIRK